MMRAIQEFCFLAAPLKGGAFFHAAFGPDAVGLREAARSATHAINSL
jgi:hypothetical protein